MVTSYKNKIDGNLLEVSPASKNTETGEWDCKVKYDGKDFVISTPRIKIFDDTLIFNIKNKKVFADFLEEIEGAISQHLFNNSAKIFKGKRFELEKIKNSLQPSIDIDDKGFVYFQTKFSETVECVDVFGEKTLLPVSRADVTALLKIDTVSFTKDLFRIRYTTTFLKFSKAPQPENINFEEEPLPPLEEIPTVQETTLDVGDNFFD